MSYHIHADSPGNISISAGIQFDPPSKCHNARNRVLFGRWMTDDWNPYIHSPFYTGIQALTFRIFGVGLAQMRITSIVFSILSLLLLYFLVSRTDGPPAGLFALLLAVVSYPFLIFSRSALLEPFALFFMLLAATCIMKAYCRADSSWAYVWMATAGLAAAAAYLSKATALCFLAAVIINVLFFPPKRKRILLAFFIGLVIILGLYAGPFFLSNVAQFKREVGFWVSRAGGYRFQSWLQQPLFVRLLHTRWLVIGAFLTVISVWTKTAPQDKRPQYIIMAIMAGTLLIWSQFLSYVSYRPSRYYMPLIGPMILLVSHGVTEAFRWSCNPNLRTKAVLLHRFISFIILSFVLKLGVVNPIVVRMAHDQRLSHMQRLILACLIALFLIMTWHLFAEWVVQRLHTIPRHIRTATLCLLILPLLTMYLYSNIHEYYRWAKLPEYGMLQFSRMLGQRYKEATFWGISPLFAVMENQHRARKVTPYRLNWKAVKNGEVTHLIQPSHVPRYFRFFKKNFPSAMQTLTRTESVFISGYQTNVYALKISPLDVITTTTSDSVKVTVSNPDPHTPRTACLLALRNKGATMVVHLCRDLDILPASKRTITVPQPRENASRLYLYLFKRKGDIPLWNDAVQSTVSWGTMQVNDDKAWNVQALRFPESNTGSCEEHGSITMKIETDGPTALVAVRLRGSISNGTQLELQGLSDGHDILRKPIKPHEIAEDRYSVVALAVPQSLRHNLDTVRVIYKGTGNVLVDALLAIGQATLLAHAINY
jgi:4-amino-4-deoxy-L-arabinose transferase-like glycosyltransferase